MINNGEVEFLCPREQYVVAKASLTIKVLARGWQVKVKEHIFEPSDPLTGAGILIFNRMFGRAVTESWLRPC